METWLKRSTRLLLSVAAAAMMVLAQTHVLLGQTQRMEVRSGSSLTLHCCLETPRRSWISWKFSSASDLSEAEQLAERSVKPSTNSCQDSEATYNLTVNETHSGWYFCEAKVDIPRLMTISSNRTEVVVSGNRVESTTFPLLMTSTPDPDHRLDLDWTLWIVLGASSFVLAVLLLVCVLQRQRCSRDTAADPIYANTRMVNQQPSPRLPEDNRTLKTGSSSQNLRTPSPGRRYEDSKRRYHQ